MTQADPRSSHPGTLAGIAWTEEVSLVLSPGWWDQGLLHGAARVSLPEGEGEVGRAEQQGKPSHDPLRVQDWPS